MRPHRPISVWGLYLVVIGALVIASALYEPFDPDYCADGCGILGTAMSNLMEMLNEATGAWGPRLIFFAVGVLLVARGWKQRLPPQKRGNP